ALVASLPRERWRANGVPDPDLWAARERAAAAVAEALAAQGIEGRLRVSPLGPAWSGDLDVYVDLMPERDALVRLGWLPLDGVLRRLGSDPGGGRWAVVEDGRVLACADLSRVDPPDPLGSVLARC